MEAGEYVRTKRGYIARVIYMGEFIELDRAINFRRTSGHFYSGQIIFDDEEELEIVKHSKNIIDLIEVGDVVYVKDVEYNETYKSEICENYENKLCIIDFECNGIRLLKESIEDNKIKLLAIVTKEQYEQNCYKLKE